MSKKYSILVSLLIAGTVITFNLPVVSAATSVGSISPALINSTTITTADPRGVVLRDPYAYVAAGNDGLIIINIGAPATPSITANVPTTCAANKVAITEDYQYAYVACDNKMVVVGTSLKQVVYQYTEGAATAVRILGNRAYALISSPTFTGLRIFDITSAWQPVVIASYATAATDFDIHKEFKYAYLLNSTTGNIEIVDVGSDTPQLLGTYTGDASFGATAIDSTSTSDSIALLSSPTNGLRVIFINGVRISVLGTYSGNSANPGVYCATTLTTRYVTRKSVSQYIHEFAVADKVGLSILRLSWTFAKPENAQLQLIDRFSGATTNRALSATANGLNHYLFGIATTSGFASLNVYNTNKIGSTIVTKLSGTKGKISYATADGVIKLSPFSGYKNNITGYAYYFGNQLGVLVVVAPTTKSKKAEIALYNGKGKLVSRQKPFGKSALNGFRLSGAYDTIFDLTELAVFNQANSSTVKLYNVLPKKISTIGSVKASVKPAKICGNFLSTTGGGTILATCANRNQSTLRVWKFNAQSASFTYQPGFSTKKLRIVGDNIKYR